MMGPDASSCLDLDECIIEPEVTTATSAIVFLMNDHFRFVDRASARTSWDPSNVSVTTASPSRTGWRTAVPTMTSAPQTCSTATLLPSVRTPTAHTTAAVGKDSRAMVSPVRSPGSHLLISP